MIVYGDLIRGQTADEKIDRINILIGAQRTVNRDLRRDLLRAIFLEESELIVALEDAGFPCGTLLTHLRGVGARLMRSWLEPAGHVPDVPLIGDDHVFLSEEFSFRYPEGYAFYAVYPEAYWLAGQQIFGTACKVIGIRSIGLSLGVMVGLGADSPNLASIRPSGHPFARHVMLPSDWSLAAGDQVAIVDEGPGMSGSSFAATADAVLRAGGDVCQLRFFPSHRNGPGVHASDATRSLWQQVHIHHVTFAELFENGQPCNQLQQAANAVNVPQSLPMQDLSGGQWQAHVRSAGSQIPSIPGREARKYLLGEGGRSTLAKFAGLGELGEMKRRRGAFLAEEGWCPTIYGLASGFIFQHWVEDAVSLEPHDLTTEDLTRMIGRYIACRSKLGTEGFVGADPLQLAAMARHNIGKALGQTVVNSLEPILEAATRLRSGWTPVATDNRMHRFEWRVSGARIWKVDALDHCFAHDMIGCQDPCWDVAGAVVELDLPIDARGDLGHAFPRDALARQAQATAFAIVCYCAFQIGLWTAQADASQFDAKSRIVDTYRTKLLQAFPHLTQGTRFVPHAFPAN
jgi:hypothetical protein